MDSLFPSGLNDVLERNTIPRILRKDEKISLYKKYYFPEFNQKFRCNKIESYDDYIFYFLSNDMYQYVLPHPVEYDCYVFTADKYNIMRRDIVSESNYVYRGYQLKWWFYKHPYHKYTNFLNIVSELDDDNVYKISSKYENGKYVDCKFMLKYKRSD
jgi:hypothetical protein